jgi:hypothetical protein
VRSRIVNGRQTGLLVATCLAAALGCLAGSLGGGVPVNPAFVILTTAALSAAAALAVVRWPQSLDQPVKPLEPARGQLPKPHHEPVSASSREMDGIESLPPTEGDPETHSESIALLVGADPDQPEPSWWDQQQADQSLPIVSDPRTRAPVELDRYVQRSQIAQCPRCGNFKLDVSHEPIGYSLKCQQCRHMWSWTPGSTWGALNVDRTIIRQPERRS